MSDIDKMASAIRDELRRQIPVLEPDGVFDLVDEHAVRYYDCRRIAEAAAKAMGARPLNHC